MPGKVRVHHQDSRYNGRPKSLASYAISEVQKLPAESREPFLSGVRRFLTSGGMNRTAGINEMSSVTGVYENGITYGAPLWYNPLIGSQDKYYFPSQQERQNAIWRAYYDLDPVVGSATDLFSDLPWSDYTLGGVRDKYILRVFEESLENINITVTLTQLTKELIIKGKVIPHLVFSKKTGMWTQCMVHDPSYVGVTGVGIAGAPPLLDMYPTPEMQYMVRSRDPRLQEFRSKLPESVISSILSGRPIPLSNNNATYIARKSSPYDVMGTSLYTRVFRVVMYEDALYNAAISVARRNAVPLRIFKLGDPSTGFFPTEQDYDDFTAKLAMAELDPAATLVYHFGLDVDYVGVSDKFLKVSDESEFITQQKLIALGVPANLLTGEASFAAQESGIQVMIERLAALRAKFEKEWIIPKVLIPIARANKFHHITRAELLHNVRIKRTPTETETLIVPKIRWHKSLEIRDTFLLEVYKDLMSRGFISNKTYAAVAGGIDLESEVENLAEDKRFMDRANEILGKTREGGPEPERLAKLVDGAVGLMIDGKTNVPELKGISPTDTESIAKTLESHGVRRAREVVERVANAKKKWDERKNLIPLWKKDDSSCLLSGV